MSAKMSAQGVSSARPAMMETLESRKLLAAVGQLVGGVDPYNMGKGEWIWDMALARTNTNTASPQALIDFLKSKGMKWIVVKAGDGNLGPGSPPFAQWNKDLITRAHTAGMKVFAYHVAYGGTRPNTGNSTSTVAGEKAVIDKIMTFNPDGLIFKVDTEWEKLATLSTANTIAEDYGKYFRDRYASKLLGYAPPAYADLHTKFPYQGFGKYADVVMPQMYWRSIPEANFSPTEIVADIDTIWKKLYGDFATAGKSDSIKPIVPLGQGHDESTFNRTTGFEVSTFVNALRKDADPASPFGYNGVGWWSAQHHNGDVWNAIGNNTISAPTGSISGNVFNDLDGDGVKDLNETGVSGRTVYDDTNNNSKFDPYEPFAKTNSSGNYTIPYRAAGVHRIRQVIPAGTRQSYPANGAAQTVTLTTGQKATAINFATTPMALLSGTVFQDLDGNGAKASTDPVLAGWTLYIDSNKNGVRDTGEPTTTSNSKGAYAFTLPAGSYQLRQVTMPGFRMTSPASGFYDVTIAAGQTQLKFFGNTTNVLISGFVFNDKNGNGIQETGESGVSGWRVWVDKDGDGVLDVNEPSVLTNSTGKYRIDSIGGGTWRIQVFVPVGWKATVPGTAARKITIASGATTSNKNFGVMQVV